MVGTVRVLTLGVIGTRKPSGLRRSNLLFFNQVAESFTFASRATLLPTLVAEPPRFRCLWWGCHFELVEAFGNPLWRSNHLDRVCEESEIPVWENRSEETSTTWCWTGLPFNGKSVGGGLCTCRSPTVGTCWRSGLLAAISWRTGLLQSLCQTQVSAWRTSSSDFVAIQELPWQNGLPRWEKAIVDFKELWVDRGVT